MQDEKKRQKDFQEEENSDEVKKRRTKKKEEPLSISFPLESMDPSSFNLPPPSNQFLTKIPNYQASNSPPPNFVTSNLSPFSNQYPSSFQQISSLKNQPISSNISPSQSHQRSSQQEFAPVYFPTPYPSFSPQSTFSGYQNLPVQFQLSNIPSTPLIPQFNSPPHPSLPRAQVQRFVIAEQPNEKQRKSYKGENRWITPHPIVIKPREVREEEGQLPNIISGSVSVRLVDHDGNEISYERQAILESNDSLRQRLDSNCKAEFLLKVMDTSEDKGFRLLFTVSYILEGVGHLEEMLYSRSFVVLSNLKKTTATTTTTTRGGKKSSSKLTKPSVDAMKPISGPNLEKTEVWIKGSNFEDVQVTFGDRDAEVEEAASNLIVARTPIRDDLTTDTEVFVQVVNKKGNTFLAADSSLQFKYEVNKLQTSNTIVADTNLKSTSSEGKAPIQEITKKSLTESNAIVEESEESEVKKSQGSLDLPS